MQLEGHYSYLRPQRQVWLFITGSALVHAGLLSLLVLGGVLDEMHSRDRDDARITAVLRLGKPRDPKLLPRKLEEAPPPAAPAPEQRAQPKPSETQPEPSRAAARPGPQSKIDYTRAMKHAVADLAKENKGEEPEGSPDGVADGDARVAQLGNEYYTKLYKAIKANYSLPETINERERMYLKATVVLFLDARGHIKEMVFEKKSGNGVFDAAVDRAIRKTAPFPAPPRELAQQYAREGIGFEFEGKSMGG